MNSDEIKQRMLELMDPIDRQIMDKQELLMLACAMLQRVTEIFDQELTVNGRKTMFKDLV